MWLLVVLNFDYMDSDKRSGLKVCSLAQHWKNTKFYVYKVTQTPINKSIKWSMDTSLVHVRKACGVLRFVAHIYIGLKLCQL